MYGANIRPYGEYFAKAQAITTSPVAGNEAGNNPQRLDAAQGGTAIRVATPKDTGTLSVPANGTLTLTVQGGKADTGPFITLGTAQYTNDTGGTKVFGADASICEFILTDANLKYPHIKVMISGSAAHTGSVDIFPHYISHPRRG